MKDVPGYEGLYAVTSCGKVWSYRYKKFMKPCICSGYEFVVLYKDGKHHNELVHRIVANAYIENPNNLPQVNHKDENKQNNCVNNLEWCDRKYNINYGNGKWKAASTRRKKVICVETGQTYTSQTECANKIGTTVANLNAHLNGKTSICCGLHFKTIGGDVYG